jgi:hypothetical protein
MLSERTSVNRKEVENIQMESIWKQAEEMAKKGRLDK